MESNRRDVDESWSFKLVRSRLKIHEQLLKVSAPLCLLDSSYPYITGTLGACEGLGVSNAFGPAS